MLSSEPDNVALEVVKLETLREPSEGGATAERVVKVPAELVHSLIPPAFATAKR